MKFTATRKIDDKLIPVLLEHQGLFYKFALILLALHYTGGVSELRDNLNAYAAVVENRIRRDGENSRQQ